MHGFAWAWAAGWFWGWLIVAVALAPVVGRRLRYEGQHVLADPQEEWDAWMAENERGSMILAEEHPLEPLPAPVVDAHPWLEQTAADLAPEALDAEPYETDEEFIASVAHVLPAIALADEADDWEPREEIVRPAYGGWVSGPCLDPGPGDAAVEPPASPGPDQPSQWLAEQLDVLRAWSEWQQQKMAVLA